VLFAFSFSASPSLDPQLLARAGFRQVKGKLVVSGGGPM
jgi:hypothetical protein